MIPTLMAILTPCLPFLIEKVATPAFDSAAGQMGEVAWQQAQALWAKLFPKVEQDPTAKVMAEKLAQEPDNPAWQGAFQESLKSLLNQDETLKQELLAILESNPATAPGNQVNVDVAQNSGVVVGTMSGGEVKQVGQVGNVNGDLNL
jgi:hypothetical protein